MSSIRTEQAAHRELIQRILEPASAAPPQAAKLPVYVADQVFKEPLPPRSWKFGAQEQTPLANQEPADWNQNLEMEKDQRTQVAENRNTENEVPNYEVPADQVWNNTQGQRNEIPTEQDWNGIQVQGNEDTMDQTQKSNQSQMDTAPSFEIGQAGPSNERPFTLVQRSKNNNKRKRLNSTTFEGPIVTATVGENRIILKDNRRTNLTEKKNQGANSTGFPLRENKLPSPIFIYGDKFIQGGFHEKLQPLLSESIKMSINQKAQIVLYVKNEADHRKATEFLRKDRKSVV